ncbi:ATP-binding protein [Parvularcula dongshanensis]|uniref:histidine kinase n=1 Tax=Parvularcula dongshanensis TaxID=1173995 RepID=A0A840HZG3_9PROT|nr:ATP-binding protein [Parvularcula dongshanensis]MBB4657959.1 two-component system sensor histidine kinase ChvG [Parvularcula dongshanensis]
MGKPARGVRTPRLRRLRRVAAAEAAQSKKDRYSALTGPFRDRDGRLPVSRLAVTILAANLVGLLILMLGSVGFNQYRDGLIAAKLEGVRGQAQMLAGVLATIAGEEAQCDIAIDAEASLCELNLDDAAVDTVFTRLFDGFEGRVRIFELPEGYEGAPIADATDFLLEDKVLRADTVDAAALPDIEEAQPKGPLGRIEEGLGRLLVEGILEPGFRQAARARTLEAELSEAFAASGRTGETGAASVRYDEEGEIVASVTVPIRRVQATYGVVTAEIGGIEEVIQQARADVLPFFLLALTASLASALFLTAAIARPIRRLATAADKVRDGIAVAGRVRIPDFGRRKDEIGELSTSLRSMTQAIYERIEAIDHFAADVSHELKNPLTSIRSAVETLDIAKTDQQRDRLLKVVKQDVARMDRLITDISNASRLDAELARETREVVDLLKLLRDIVELYGTTAKPGAPTVRLLGRTGAQPLYVFGSPSALGQVFRNLIDNALSFSPQGGVVRVTLGVERAAEGPVLKVQVADDGPGIPDGNLETIFKRFYTERPAGADFGNNSGLGLAICRQIVESHGGRIWAENRMNAERSARIGAMFTVLLPLRRSGQGRRAGAEQEAA